MKKTIKRSARLTLLAPLMLFGIGGRKPDTSHMCGGTTDKTDDKAPKEIKSKDITKLSVTFYVRGEWSSIERKEQYSFGVEPNENGELTLTERTLGISVPADNVFLAQLQQVIDDTRLVLRNGVYRVTAGLPPPYQPCHVTVEYASGEKLSYTENNNPDDEWIKLMYPVFAEQFAKGGIDILLIPNYKGVVDSINLDTYENGVYTWYSRITVLPEDAIDGRRDLFGKRRYNASAKKETLTEYILLPDDFYETVTEIIHKYDLREFDRCSVLYIAPPKNTDNDETSDSKDKISLHIHHEDGHQLNIETKDPERIEKLRPLVNELIEYYDHILAIADKKTGKRTE